MPDAIFAHPGLAEIYDELDGDRADLDRYVAMAEQFGSRAVIDLGCGTGTLACRLGALGLDVVGVDPAAASLDVARLKPGADRVRWVRGDALAMPAGFADLITMTGNVAQVFVDDDEWHATLRACRRSLDPGGRLVFEVRDPAARAWEQWSDEVSRSTTMTRRGEVESWVEVTSVELPLVSFRWTFRFIDDSITLRSDSTLRFRSRAQIEASLANCGFEVDQVADAPDRPGLEFVFIASRV